MGTHDERMALMANLHGFDAACASAGLSPAYVLLRDKKAFKEGWQKLLPSLDEVVRHLDGGPANTVGLQPASLGCVVLDCDEGDGPEAGSAWAGGAWAVNTPSSSGSAVKGHVWVRCEDAEAVRNWDFRVDDPLDGWAAGELRTVGGQVRLRAEALRLLTEAVSAGRITTGDRLSPLAFASIRKGGAASTVDVELDWEDGREACLDDLPEKLREAVTADVPTGGRSEAVARLVWSIVARGISAASALTILQEHCAFAVEKYGERLEEQVGATARAYLATKKLEVDDFDDAPDLPPEATREAEGGGTIKGPLERMNDDYCCAMIGNKFRVMWRTRAQGQDGKKTNWLTWIDADKQAFFDWQANKSIEKGGKAVPLAKAWFEWGGRRQYNGVTFDPNGRVQAGYLNLWTGFGTVPDRTASCERTVEMVREVLCSGDAASFEYLMNWLSWKVKNPGSRNEVAVVFRGKKGVGKTTLGEVMADIFGAHSFIAKNIEDVAGRFNGHLEQVAFVFGDEVYWGGNKEAEGRLKKLITDARTSTEKKGQDQYRSMNRVSLMMATNEKWAVPVSLDGERRFFVLDVSDKRMAPDGTPPDHPNRVYWNEVHHELDNGGREAFFALLLDRELPRGWHPRSSVPRTDGLAMQMVESLDPMQRWYLDAVQAGRLPGTVSLKDKRAAPPGWRDGHADWADVDHFDPPRLDPTTVLEDFRVHARAAGSRYGSNQGKLGPFLAEFGWMSKKSNGIVTYRPPSLEAAQEAWTRKLGGRSLGLFDEDLVDGED